MKTVKEIAAMLPGYQHVRFEVFWALTVKNDVFWEAHTRATWRNIPEDGILQVMDTFPSVYIVSSSA
jgi:hypothetical protein